MFTMCCLSFSIGGAHPPQALKATLYCTSHLKIVRLVYGCEDCQVNLWMRTMQGYIKDVKIVWLIYGCKDYQVSL